MDSPLTRPGNVLGLNAFFLCFFENIFISYTKYWNDTMNEYGDKSW